MQFWRKHSATSNILRVLILDSSVTTGAGKTGLAYNTSGLIISTIADNEATATVYTVAAGNVEDITTLGTFAAPTASKCRFKAVDGTNHPGLYELQIADARFAVSGATYVDVTISGASNAAQTTARVWLTQFDPQEAPANMAVRIADTVLRRTAANAEASANGDAVSLGCLYGLIQQSQEFAISGTTLTVYKTDGSTSLGTRSLTKTADDPIRGAS